MHAHLAKQGAASVVLLTRLRREILSWDNDVILVGEQLRMIFVDRFYKSSQQ